MTAPAGTPGFLAGIRPYRSLWRRELWWLLGLALATAALFQLLPLDLWVQRGLHNPNGAPPDWLLKQVPPWLLLRDYGTLPALFTAIGAFLYLLASLRWPQRARFRVHALFLIVALVVGPGLMVNHVFKLNWGRPRPAQTEEFGGYMPYRDALEPGVRGRGRSFPCGHSSVGYYFTAVYLLLHRRQPRAGRWALGGALTAGSLIGFGRMAAGSHYLSDVVWSGLMVHATNVALYYFAFNIPAHDDGVAPRRRLLGSHAALAAVSTILVLVIVAGVVMATAHHRRVIHSSGALSAGVPADLVLTGSAWNVTVEFAPRQDVELEFEGRGFGLPWSDMTSAFVTNVLHDGREIRFVYAAKGWFYETDVNLVVRLPLEGVRQVEMGVGDGTIRLNRPPPGTDPPAVRVRQRRGTLSIDPFWRDRLPAAADPDVMTVYRPGAGNDDRVACPDVRRAETETEGTTP